ncbi:MAG: hypothetical protein RL518_2479 [Pseudomonadota bacterium]
MKLLSTLCVIAGAVFAIGSTPASAQTTTTPRVWTISEILAERQTPVENNNPRMCMGGRFKPCVCAADVTKLVQYRPSIAQCGKKAGIVMSGEKYIKAFSVVVRDRDNRDRWPLEFPATGTGYGGCTLAQAKAGLGKCSAFKVQKIIKVSNENGNAEVHCLGQSGYHPLMRGISRMTIKLKDVPGSHEDPLERLCLKGPTVPLN